PIDCPDPAHQYGPLSQTARSSHKAVKLPGQMLCVLCSPSSGVNPGLSDSGRGNWTGEHAQVSALATLCSVASEAALQSQSDLADASRKRKLGDLDLGTVAT